MPKNENIGFPFIGRSSMKRLTAIGVMLLMLLGLTSTVLTQWRQTSGPQGGIFGCFAGRPNKNGGTNIFAGGDGIFFSANNGVNWSPVGKELPKERIQCLLIADSALFVAYGDPPGPLWGGRGGISTSMDEGVSWNRTVVNQYISALVAVPDGRGAKNLFAGTWGGILRSTDIGKSWSSASIGIPPMWTRAFTMSTKDTGGTNLFTGGGRIAWPGSKNGIYLSTDNGESWESRNDGMPDTLVTTLLTAADDGNIIFAGTYGAGVFTSNNNGMTWTSANIGLTNPLVTTLAQSGDFLFVGTDGGGVFVSTDGGMHWIDTKPGLPYEHVLALAAYPDSTGRMNLLAGTKGGGIYLSTDNGNNWSVPGTGLPLASVSALQVVSLPSGRTNLIAGTYGSGIYQSSDNGDSWTATARGLPYASVQTVAMISAGPGDARILAGTNGGGIFLSSDFGARWVDASAGLTNKQITSFAASGDGARIFAGSVWDGAFLSTDNGTSWIRMGQDPTEPLINALVELPGPGGSSNLYSATTEGVFRSSNDGANWVPAGLPGQDVDALAIVSNGTGEKRLVAGLDGGRGVFLTTDSATTWMPSSTSITDGAIDVFAAAGSDLFAGTIGGVLETGPVPGKVFHSTDGGANWKPISEGLVDTDIRALAVGAPYLFAGTSTGGVWRRPLSEMLTSVENTRTNVSTRFTLYQNYPNPFNPTTTIEYTVRGARDQGLGVSEVRMVIFDMLGRNVAELVNARQLPGTYAVKFDGSRLSSGVYFYRLTVGSYSTTKAMLLER